ncbi:glycosyltransferase family 2 protein [Paenibacillus silagei]|uniref:Tetratricopeptide (TPR) repeat protein n=1 Tax=Paenibacillus silagei TaxID=1670801 RepID=A0ABS4NNN6_9BACL|nr:glycosyltransferase family 2 protein [Paenibacillus silagei]MBP2111674.1 tetratricopeptide (TPR) repeat protein [Paenibacillus silagei]
MEAEQQGLFTLCMIVKNEEAVLGRCLDSVRDLMDEIVIIDTGSTDRTVTVAGWYTEKVFAYPWDDDFAAARNYSFEQATMPYVFWMDADELLAAQEAEKLARLKQQLAQEQAGVEVIWMGTRLFLQSFQATSAVVPVYSERRPRLVRRGHFHWQGRVHEELDTGAGTAMNTDIYIDHRPSAVHTERNLRILKRWIAEEGKAEGRLLFHYANECFGSREYQTAAASYEELLQEPRSCKEERITACLRLSECYRELGEPELRLNSLFRSFSYGLPQADVCCGVAGFFEERRDWESAIYWYLQAIALQTAGPGDRPVSQAYYTWMPHVLISRCFAAAREWQQAYQHNERALAYLPGNQVLLGTRIDLQQVLEERRGEKE